jgi:hypothetical protein
MKALVTLKTDSIDLVGDQQALQFKVTIAHPDGSSVQRQLVDDPTVPVTFDDLVPGDYIVLASRIDQTGADIVPPVTASFSIAAPATAVTAQVPVSITIQLGG